jgi:hypothetical protein
MSDGFDKGDRVGILPGRQGAGMRGEVFWIGESRYGKGRRYGVRGDDGETYWVDEEQVGPEEQVPAPVLPEREERAPLAKGARVTITGGEGAGQSGEVFWVGESRFGRGMRYGVRVDDEQTYWVDEHLCEPLEEGSAPAAGEPAEARWSARDRSFDDDAPLPGDDDLAFRDDGAPLPTDDDFALRDDGAPPPTDEDLDFGDDEPPF